MVKMTARVKIDKEVWLRIRAKAIMTGKSVADYVGEILARAVERGNEEKKE